MANQHAWFACFFAFLFLLNPVFAQKKWVGGATGKWELASCWEPQGMPDSTDDVVLDNSFVPADYVLEIPDTPVVLHSLTISPLAGKRIELVLPPTNKRRNAFGVKAEGDGIVIRNGGIFRNASGLTSGQSLRIDGSWKIENGGHYIHNTRALHATEIVANLSDDSGTERGVFEFDVPGGSYSISISNRTYGKLILSAQASQGQQTYNGSGGNPLTIQSDLEINEGVRFNLDMTKDVLINGNFIQHDGVFNMASQSNFNTVKIKGHLFQGDSGIITETAGGVPILELSGDSSQDLALHGAIRDSITIRIDNTGPAILRNSLRVPFMLELVKGKILTSDKQVLILASNSSVLGASSLSFIDGPLEKEGDDDFEFPIGKGSDYAPLKMTGTGGAKTDVFRAEYFLTDPGQEYGRAFENPPMVRISALECWKLDRRAGTSSKKLGLAVRTYSDATALDMLVVARWDEETLRWKSEGISSWTGNATGSITSNEVSGFGAFTLGSTVEKQNPLPLALAGFTPTRQPTGIVFSWITGQGYEPYQFEIEMSPDGTAFTRIGQIAAQAGKQDYRVEYPDLYKERVSFRLKVVEKGAIVVYSPITWVTGKSLTVNTCRILPSVISGQGMLEIFSDQGGACQYIIMDMTGRAVRKGKQPLIAGLNSIPLDLSDLSAGVYSIHMFDERGRAALSRFVKK